MSLIFNLGREEKLLAPASAQWLAFLPQLGSPLLVLNALLAFVLSAQIGEPRFIRSSTLLLEPLPDLLRFPPFADL
jgi:hypothetical protein